MQTGNFEVGELGYCELNSVLLGGDTTELVLYHELDDTPEEIGYICVAPDPWGDDKAVKEISDLFIRREFRGKGAGSFLVDQAIEDAKQAGLNTLQTCAVNERTVSSFCRHFNLPDLSFYKKHGIDEPPRPIQISPSGAIDYLRKRRKEQIKQSGVDGELKGFGIHILGRLARTA